MLESLNEVTASQSVERIPFTAPSFNATAPSLAGTAETSSTVGAATGNTKEAGNPTTIYGVPRGILACCRWLWQNDIARYELAEKLWQDGIFVDLPQFQSWLSENGAFDSIMELAKDEMETTRSFAESAVGLRLKNALLDLVSGPLLNRESSSKPSWATGDCPPEAYHTSGQRQASVQVWLKENHIHHHGLDYSLLRSGFASRAQWGRLYAGLPHEEKVAIADDFLFHYRNPITRMRIQRALGLETV